MADLTKRSPDSRIPIRLPVSLRTRLIVGNILITVVSIAALWYYVFFRGQQASAFLSDELDASVRQKAVDSLTATSVHRRRSGWTSVESTSRHIAAG